MPLTLAFARRGSFCASRHRRTVLGSFDLSRAFASDASELAQAHERAKIAHPSNIRAAGDEVEEAVRSYLQRMLPPSYRVTKGHVIDRTGAVSPQLDIVITDSRGFASLMTTSDGTEYIPFTSVHAVGEIKSTYYKSEAPTAKNARGAPEAGCDGATAS